MQTYLRILAGCVLFAAVAAAQVPSITGVANNYSGIAPGLPNYGIAQGSIFLIIGSNLTTADTGLQTPPLKTTLSGTSVNVTVNGTTTHPIFYYVTHSQIAAILPSATPVGTGTITVTTSAGTSPTAPITVVQSAFGILTMNQAGNGLGQIQDANNSYSLLSYTASAKPGDAIVLWGSGLGPVTGDETQYQTQTDFGSTYPIEVDLGGVSATVLYHGRSAYPGLDEVIVAVPSSLSGCNVSAVVWHKANNFVSNVVTLPVAATGGACSDPSTPYTSTLLQKCFTTGCSIGSLGITKTTTTTQPTTISGITIPGSTSTSDGIGGAFYKYTATQISTGIAGPSAVSIGSCSVYSFSYNGNTPPAVPTGATASPLNAGTISATTPSTTATMPYQNGGYSASSSTGSLIPASGGTFSFTNGSGGPDIGTFSGAQITLGAPLIWTNQPTSVTRSKGLTVTWTGGTSGTTVTLFGYSLAPVGNSTTSFVGAYFWCTAPVSAGTLTVPSTVLLALPASGSITSGGISIPLPGALSLSNQSNTVTFTAPNLDFGYLAGTYSVSNSLTFQ
jgi:uncharacterized protein (TIGR03437 family)